jgi:diguanylate cyclase
VRVSVDDFGTGYSSLARLQRLPIDVVKIDRTFVHRIGRNSRESAMAQAVIVIAHSLDLTVVAEGVETPEQYAFLRAQGCDLYQGHLLSPPLPAAEMVRYLERAQAAMTAGAAAGSAGA